MRDHVELSATDRLQGLPTHSCGWGCEQPTTRSATRRTSDDGRMGCPSRDGYVLEAGVSRYAAEMGVSSHTFNKQVAKGDKTRGLLTYPVGAISQDLAH